jgi:hypothetical protein
VLDEKTKRFYKTTVSLKNHVGRCESGKGSSCQPEVNEITDFERGDFRKYVYNKASVLIFVEKVELAAE